MLIKTSAVKGYAITAIDGEIGSISDFLFDDVSWMLRWVVVETGSWLFGRKVLLPISALGHPNTETNKFPVRLSMEQIKNSPDIDTERTVSRQMETSVYDYYGWNPYWGGGFYPGGYGLGYGGGYIGGAMLARPSPENSENGELAAERRREDDDTHLRSVDAVTGYNIHASDGEIGHVEDFLIEDADWSVHYIVVDTKNWWPAKKVLVSPRSAQAIDWSLRLLNLNISREKVKQSPVYDASTIVDQAYEKQFASHYGQ